MYAAGDAKTDYGWTIDTQGRIDRRRRELTEAFAGAIDPLGAYYAPDLAVQLDAAGAKSNAATLEAILAAQDRIQPMLDRAMADPNAPIDDLHAAVAAAALFRSKLITWRSLPARVQTVGPEAGVLAFERKPSRTACGVRVAVDLDVEGFESLFWRRICAFAGET